SPRDRRAHPAASRRLIERVPREQTSYQQSQSGCGSRLQWRPHFVEASDAESSSVEEKPPAQEQLGNASYADQQHQQEYFDRCDDKVVVDQERAEDGHRPADHVQVTLGFATGFWGVSMST